MRHIRLLFVLVPALALLSFQIACGEKQENIPAREQKPVTATVTTVRYETIPAVIEAPGTVQPRNRVAISSQINGFVREMRVRIGDNVRPNQVLAALDSRDAENQKAAAQAAIDEAQAALSEARRSYQAAVEMHAAAKASAELAEQTLGRYQKLFESDSVSPQEIDEIRSRKAASAAELASKEAMMSAARDRIKQVEARIAQAKAQAGRADVQLSWTRIKAPAAGKIVERAADPGTAIFPGTPLLVIESTARPQVLASIPTEFSNKLRVGMKVQLRQSGAADLVDGRVTEISPMSNPATHSVEFKVDLPASYSAPSGRFVQVNVPVGTRNAMLLPAHAVRTTGQLTGLFVVDGDSKAQYRLVKAAPYDRDRLEILTGLEPGEMVVTGPGSQITDGITVEIRHE